MPGSRRPRIHRARRRAGLGRRSLGHLHLRNRRVVTIDCRIDHLVVAARTLDQGVQWCEATLGVTPGAGGEHPLMGTHNRLLRIATVQYPRAYLEIIAIDPAAQTPSRRR